MTIPRKDYKVQVSDKKAISIDRLNVFGWNVFFHTMPVGSSFIIYSQKTVTRDKTPNIAFYTKGIASAYNSVLGQLDDRIPGLFTGHRPPHPEGTSIVTAIEEVEFWCFNWHINRGSLPELTPIILENGEKLNLPLQSNVLLCRGNINNFIDKDTFIINDQENYIAKTKSYILVFKEKRNV